MTCYGCPGGCQRCGGGDYRERARTESRTESRLEAAQRLARRDTLEAIRAAITDYPTLRVIAELEARLRAEKKL